MLSEGACVFIHYTMVATYLPACLWHGACVEVDSEGRILREKRGIIDDRSSSFGLFTFTFFFNFFVVFGVKTTLIQ